MLVWVFQEADKKPGLDVQEEGEGLVEAVRAPRPARLGRRISDSAGLRRFV